MLFQHLLAPLAALTGLAHAYEPTDLSTNLPNIPALNDTAPLCPSRPATPSTQRALFRAFISATYNRTSTIAAAYTTFAAEDYIQHNPWMTSGRQAAIDTLTPIFAVADLRVRHVWFDPELETGTGGVHYRLRMPGAERPVAVMRLFRWEGTCLVEHWDVMQEVPGNKTNPLPMV